VEETYKTLLATCKSVGAVIRVVLAREADGWLAFFATGPNPSVQKILEAVANRETIERDFHDLNEVHGAGEQRVRNVWTNMAIWHLPWWLFTMIELWAWN
jgi:hypothetical protein